MSSLQARQLLWKAANLLVKEKQMLSKEEIVEKINHIKYLAAQKKAPRIVIKKEMEKLEGQVQSFLELGKILQRKKLEESYTVTSLKKQILLLRKRLAVAEDKDLSKKVEKLSHLLGEMLAKCGTAEEIERSRKMLQEVGGKAKLSKRLLGEKKPAAPPPEAAVPAKERPLTEEDRAKIELMQNRLTALKHELEISKILGKRGNLQSLQQQISLLESKLNWFTSLAMRSVSRVTVAQAAPEVAPGLLPAGESIKHDLLFGPVTVSVGKASIASSGAAVPPSFRIKSEVELEAELPLPPPPRRK